MDGNIVSVCGCYADKNRGLPAPIVFWSFIFVVFIMAALLSYVTILIWSCVWIFSVSLPFFFFRNRHRILLFDAYSTKFVNFLSADCFAALFFCPGPECSHSCHYCHCGHLHSCLTLSKSSVQYCFCNSPQFCGCIRSFFCH